MKLKKRLKIRIIKNDFKLIISKVVIEMNNNNNKPTANKAENNNEVKNDKSLTFEKAIEKLEAHVRTLEQGELTLDESLTIFEEGMKLAKFCTKKLDEAEQKIEILLEKNGDFIKEPFNVPTEEE